MVTSEPQVSIRIYALLDFGLFSWYLIDSKDQGFGHYSYFFIYQESGFEFMGPDGIISAPFALERLASSNRAPKVYSSEGWGSLTFTIMSHPAKISAAVAAISAPAAR